MSLLVDYAIDTAKSALGDVTSPHLAFMPPKRMSVSDGAKANFIIKQPGGYTGPWSAEETPYMVEPMDMLASRRHEAVCFVGPARTGKTSGLIQGALAHFICNDPGDALVVSMTQEKAREWSKTDLARLLRNSPGVSALMTGSGQDQNTFDVSFKHGMWLKIAWPTVSNLSGSTYRYVFMTDLDRMPDDVDGEGSPFALGLKRTTTFMSRGMALVESSPGRDVTDPNWHPATPHEAPPCTGILGIYNRSDRRRWYWPCPHCDEYFEAKPGLELFGLPEEQTLSDIVREADIDEMARQYGKLICPHCGCLIEVTKKNGMNQKGVWVGDGQRVRPDGTLEGDLMRASIAGYWLGGVAAAYQSWHSLLSRYLLGLREYSLTGSDLTLRTTVNTDQGAPFLSRSLAYDAKLAAKPDERKDDDLERYIVPDEARFVVVAVDVQGGTNARFVVQAHAVGPHMEQWPIDRYAITVSNREGVDGDKAPLDPAAYAEDWETLTTIIKSTYRTTVEGRELRVKLLVCDTGGEDGVTERAYAWYRRLRTEGLHNRAMLVKGASTPTAPFIRESWVGVRRKGEKGDVPIYLLGTNLLKDAVSTNLKRTKPGPGYIHMPGWLPKSFFDELQAEVRMPNGRWQQLKKRNEAFDLSCYIHAACVRLGADREAFWINPPPWANTLDEGNSDIVTSDERREMQEDAPPVIRRRVARSSYVAR